MNLFSEHSEPILLPLKDATVIYYPAFFNAELAQIYFDSILLETDWQEDDITLFGKTYKQPRLTALFANNGLPYSYSNIVMHPEPFTESLLKIKQDIEKICDHEFTTCLANLYRDGSDSNGWHSDDEKELGKQPVIASVSLGATRKFQLKHKTNKELKHQLQLSPGSLLVMKGNTQEFWKHQIPKTKVEVGQRISLTFRTILK